MPYTKPITIIRTPDVRRSADGWTRPVRGGRTAWQRERENGAIVDELPKPPLVPRLVRAVERLVRR